jgi:cytochrome b
MPETDRARRRVLVWDLPVRVFHWATVALMPVLYLTWRWNWMDWHALAGETVLALVLFRLLWGVLGSDTARFSHFIASPRAAWRHLMQVRRPEPDNQLGHNPAGGWMVLALLALLLGLTLSGLFVQNDVADEGPFTQLLPAAILNGIDDLHTVLWNLLLAAVLLHVLAVLAYAILLRHNLIGPMLTGRKLLPDSVPKPRVASVMLALVLLACAAGVTGLVATML